MMADAYYEVFERLVSELADCDSAPYPEPGHMLDEICDVLRIERIEVMQFRNYVSERQEDGNLLCLHDEGHPYKDEPLVLRVENENRTINRCRSYPYLNGEPWTEVEKSRIMIFLKTLYSFISRTRLLKLANKFAFYDDAGYTNLRYFYKSAWEYLEHEKLDKMNAYHFNLKHFSLVNQQIGRRAGDAVMRCFYDGLQKLIEGNGCVCRVGGDNFVILADKKYTQDIIAYLSGTGVVYDETSGEKILVSACAGVFEIPPGFRFNGEFDLMDRVVSCTQAAKNSDTTDIVFFSEEMMEQKRRAMKIQRLLPEALAKNEFLVYYQPKVAVNGRELSGAEALCRWQHGGKLIPPSEFIPVLEAGMEICTLDFYMLDKVCKDIRRWLDTGLRVVRISVNLSRRHMVDMNLLDHLIGIVDSNNVPHEYIEIELTETTTDVEFTDLKRVVGGLQAVGISTSVDDFGIGYSSLNLIKEIPWNVLKVDKSFLPEKEESSGSRRSVMFRHVVSMARELGLECITEGVETAEHVQLLLDSHCDLAQGFYYDRPLPVEEFEKRLVHHTYQK
ncbi:MAG: GGDEF domain-containing phosphodiesterase [Oscillospiraceae bacterium]|nr:GGDEF domain-containing phosphodiesterase [Oscillospiraceae bacterium]